MMDAEETIVVGGDRPFLLRAPDVWRVAAGQVDVFTVRLEDGEPKGPRVHLLRVAEGGALFGVGAPARAEAWGLLAVGFQGTQLAKLRPPADGGGDPPALVALAESWIHSLYAGLTRDRLPAISTELVSGREVDVADAASVRVHGELGWVRHLQGRSRLLGREGLEVNGEGFLPVSRGAWLEAVTASRMLAVETRGLPSPAEVWAGLNRLHDLVLRFADVGARTAERAARVRTEQKAAFREAILQDACERLAATTAPGHDRAAMPLPASGLAAVADAQDPLFAACALVGGALGLTLKSPGRSPGAAAPRDPLAAILRVSRVRSRLVALRDRWWRHDHGALLAYLSEGKRPVALLRSRAHGPYVLHDPVLRTKQPVDAAVAEGLEPFAYSFYRPFPDKRLGIRDVVQFGLHGCAQDAGVLIGVAVCASLLGTVPAVATGMAFNEIIPGAQRSQLLQMTLVLLATATATALFNLAQGVALLRIEGRASAGLQSAVWDRLLALPLPFFRPYTSGDLAVRAMSIDAIRQVVSGSTASALMGGIFAVGNLCLMYWYSWKMALWATVVIAAVVSVTLAGTFLQLRPQREAMKLQSKAAGVVLQLLSSISKLRVAGAEVPAFALWVRRFSEQRRLYYKARRTSNWVTAFTAAVPLAANLVIFYVGLPLVTEERALDTGSFLAFLAAFSSCSSALIATSLALLATLNTIPLYEQAKPILETLPEVDLGKADPGVLTGEIEVQHATFRYQEGGLIVLRDVSFRIHPGQFVAFVGPSGSGKSTLLRLLLGFETLEAGGIYYDGQELGGLDVQALRRQMGVVLQSGRVMSGDIFTNIVGSSAASLAEAWEAARLAGLAEDIEAMPMGMHTHLSEGAGTLSGGQRQRLLIARAIVNRPRILLFDEATSALDNRTQATVSASLEALQATRIVVAHRLSTIMNADQIFVMDRGRLVQSGRYAELMAQEGRFAELAKRQIA